MKSQDRFLGCDVHARLQRAEKLRVVVGESVGAHWRGLKGLLQRVVIEEFGASGLLDCGVASWVVAWFVLGGARCGSGTGLPEEEGGLFACCY